jgi:hypothetical protein
MNDEETFNATFGPVSVTVRFNYGKYFENKSIPEAITFEWTGKLPKDILPKYVSWMHTVMRQVAKRANEKILYVYLSYGGESYDWYVYNPDGTYERISRPH